MKSDVIIIGGGVGGLFTGAFLAKEGRRVTVLEKNAHVGGGLHNFVRRGEQYETGMHLLGGLQEGGSLRRIMRYLGIWDNLLIQREGCGNEDVVIYGGQAGQSLLTEENACPPVVYRIPKGRGAFTSYLCSQFPSEANGIEAYVEKLYDLTDEIELYSLRPTQTRIMEHGEDFYMPADQLIARYVKDETLRDLLSYLTFTYAGEAGCTMAYIHALINVSYINGTYQFVGGSQQLADQLVQVIEQAGGEVHAGETVTSIVTSAQVEDDQQRVPLSSGSNHSVVAVLTEKGNRYEADCYVSAVQPSVLFRLLPAHTFSRAFLHRFESMTDTYSTFNIYLKLHPGTFPLLKSPIFYQDRVGMAWNRADHHDTTWPHTFVLLTPPSAENESFASHLLMLIPMRYELVEQWKDLPLHRRGEEYESFKQQHIEMALNRLSTLFCEKPFKLMGISQRDIRTCIDDCFASTPLTLRDYLGNRSGSLYGYLKDAHNPMLSHVAIRSKLSNLFLTGQNIHVHGLCGVIMTALETSEEILGHNTILNKIE